MTGSGRERSLKQLVEWQAYDTGFVEFNMPVQLNSQHR